MASAISFISVMDSRVAGAEPRGHRRSCISSKLASRITASLILAATSLVNTGRGDMRKSFSWRLFSSTVVLIASIWRCRVWPLSPKAVASHAYASLESHRQYFSAKWLLCYRGIFTSIYLNRLNLYAFPPIIIKVNNPRRYARVYDSFWLHYSGMPIFSLAMGQGAYSDKKYYHCLQNYCF